MKQTFHKLISLVLSLILLISTFSFTVESHFCGDHLVDIAVFSTVDGCSMEMKAKTSQEEKITKKGCCKDVAHFVEGNSIEQQAIHELNLSQVYFVTSFVLSSQETLANTTCDDSFYQYIPPLVNRDITVLFENFRI